MGLNASNRCAGDLHRKSSLRPLGPRVSLQLHYLETCTSWPKFLYKPSQNCLDMHPLRNAAKGFPIRNHPHFLGGPKKSPNLLQSPDNGEERACDSKALVGGLRRVLTLTVRWRLRWCLQFRLSLHLRLSASPLASLQRSSAPTFDCSANQLGKRTIASTLHALWEGVWNASLDGMCKLPSFLLFAWYVARNSN